VKVQEEIDPRGALDEIERVRANVRRSSRWAGRLLLVMGVGSIAYWAAMLLGPGAVQTVAGWGWGLFVVSAIIFAFRQGVYDPVTHRLQWPVTGLYALTTIGAVLFGLYVLPEDDRGPGWVAAAVAVSVIAGLPLIIGGWRVLHLTSDRHDGREVDGRR